MTLVHTDAELGHAFSHPGASPDLRRRLRRQLLAEDARLRTVTFLRQHADAVARASRGLVEVLSAWTDGEPTLAEAMSHPLAQRSLREPGLEPAWLAAWTAAHLAVAGRDGAWDVTFAAPQVLVLGARVTPPIVALELSASAGALDLHLTLASGEVRRVALAPGTDVAPDGWATIPSVKTNEGRVLLLGREARGLWHIEVGEYGDATAPTAELLGALEAGWATLERWAPAHYAWAEEGIRGVVPSALPAGAIAHSVSVTGHPSVVYASLPVPAIRSADLMVHEACHQFFDYAQLDTLLTNGRDTGMYWSPYVGRERPLDRLLLGFHAFANVAILYRTCLEAGLPVEPGSLAAEVDAHLGHLGPMRDVLDRSPGLTAAGRALFEPLRDALFG